MTIVERPDVNRELLRLKDFQRATVAHVNQRLWLDEQPARSFLVADQVGLGKTMVARGVIAHTIDHLWHREDRIDIIYICSNSQIARQNLRRLAIEGFQVDHANRLTMLPEALKGLRQNKVNFISFTPGTSFTIRNPGATNVNACSRSTCSPASSAPTSCTNRAGESSFAAVPDLRTTVADCASTTTSCQVQEADYG